MCARALPLNRSALLPLRPTLHTARSPDRHVLLTAATPLVSFPFLLMPALNDPRITPGNLAGIPIRGADAEISGASPLNHPATPCILSIPRAAPNPN